MIIHCFGQSFAMLHLLLLLFYSTLFSSSYIKVVFNSLTVVLALL